MKHIGGQLEADTGISFRKIAVDSEYEEGEKYRIRSVPDFILVEDGKEISRAAGAQTGKELSAALAI